MTTEEFKTQMLESTERVFAMCKEVRPMLAILNEDELKFLPLLMDNKDRVAATIASMRAMFPMVMFVTEAWAVEVKGKTPEEADDALSVPPSQHPDRIEILSVLFYFGMKVEGFSAEIIRPASGDPLLGPWKSVGDSIGGRMATPPPQWN